VALGATEAKAKRILEATPYNNNAIAGTPEQVAEQLQRFVDVGVEYLCVRMVDFPRSEGIELFAQEVVPLLQSH
jgi:alkanesulfonate monooxygenase SsuD/methylene tetrahydromethanopterin reductase-like flavin-dependent oxidoreductase (luciferase family)